MIATNGAPVNVPAVGTLPYAPSRKAGGLRLLVSGFWFLASGSWFEAFWLEASGFWPQQATGKSGFVSGHRFSGAATGFFSIPL
jgi:hypothetical protein